ncbi:MAG: helicase/secretion neighborhood TadE-like protein [Ilumatobacter sp.]|nr:helicase/secretion neighborhood TadE-like protein [Ilumatobacter sp.]
MVVVAVVAVLGAGLVTALADFGAGAQDRVRAQSAADAAALASLHGGRASAAALATRNGGVVLSWQRRGGDVVVVVRVGRSTATARASDQP